MFDAAHPCRAAFDAHSEAGVRDCSEASQVEIPFKCFAREIMRFQLLFEELQIHRAFAAADDFAVAFGREQVRAERKFGARRISFKVKRFNDGGEMMNEDRRVESAGNVGFIGRAEVAAPFEIVFKLALDRKSVV